MFCNVLFSIETASNETEAVPWLFRLIRGNAVIEQEANQAVMTKIKEVINYDGCQNKP